MDVETQPEATLERAGARATTQRLAIIRAIAEIDRHFEPEQLVDHLQRQGHRVSRATVYRALPLLVHLGVIREVYSEDRHRHYERTVATDHHDHLVCMQCGRVEEFVDDRIERIQEDICRRHGFEPVGHRTEIIGLCRKCARRGPTAAPAD